MDLTKKQIKYIKAIQTANNPPLSASEASDDHFLYLIGSGYINTYLGFGGLLRLTLTEKGQKIILEKGLE